MISHIALVLFLLVACNSCAAKLSPYCKRLVTEHHLQNLSDLIDTQMKSSCKITFNYVEESDLDPVCFLKAAYRPLGHLLRNEMKFKEDTVNSRIQDMLTESHANLDEDCFKTKADESQSSARCIKKFSLSAAEMLELVRRYFRLVLDLLQKEQDFSRDCSIRFHKCSDSQSEAVVSSGVVTDRDCDCPATSPITRGPMTPFLQTFEPLPSIADQLDSKETAASTLQVFMLPGTIQTQGQPESSSRPRVPRSTYQGPDLDAGAAAMSSAPEALVLTSLSQGPDPGAVDTESFQDLTLSSLPRPSNSPSLPASWQQAESMGTESPLPGSEAASSQISLSGLDKASPHNQWLRQTRDVAKAIPGLPSGSGRTDSSSTSSLSLTSFATLEPWDSSVGPPSGNWAIFPPSDPALSPILGAEEPFSTSQQSFRASARQISPDSHSWGEQSSRGQAPRMQQSTQLRERRAGRGEEGLAKDREPEDSLSGPNFDLHFVPLNADKSSKKPDLRDSQSMTLSYVLVPSVLGILLAVGGLLFYLHKSRVLARRRQQSMGNDIEEQEESPLRGGEEDLELQTHEEL
ncbi:macrophage colony-stimulating factor 1 isoform X2 [Paroedura picta]|uniref:macrophage colony-stimulating factor 1 isoform X2 n=1 Tax=Paroedura picta TaxID=143630 RepID=UPI0040574EFC